MVVKAFQRMSNENPSALRVDSPNAAVQLEHRTLAGSRYLASCSAFDAHVLGPIDIRTVQKPRDVGSKAPIEKGVVCPIVVVAQAVVARRQTLFMRRLPVFTKNNLD